MPSNIDSISYASYIKIADDTRFSAWLRHCAEPYWSEMIEHRFVHDMAADRLAPAVLERYLVYEYGFVRAAVKIFGYALIKASDLADQIRLVGVLEGLTGEQIDYFKNTFDRLDIPQDKREPSQLPTEVRTFRDEMLQLATDGRFEEILTGIAAAEWMYLTWCRNAEQAAPKNPIGAEWIALHTAPGFTNQVQWLKARLDDFGPQLPPDRQIKLAEAFRETLRLEIDFHDAPYSEKW